MIQLYESPQTVFSIAGTVPSRRIANPIERKFYGPVIVLEQPDMFAHKLCALLDPPQGNDTVAAILQGISNIGIES